MACVLLHSTILYQASGVYANIFFKKSEVFLPVISICFDVFLFFTVFIVFCLLSIMSIYSFRRGSLPQSAHLPPKSRLYSPAVQYSSSAAHEPRRACALRGPPPDKVGVNQFSLLQCRPFGRTAPRLGSVFFLLAEDNNACARNDRCNTNADEAHCAGYRRIGSIGGNCGGFIGDGRFGDGRFADHD